jgi:hypothetical protein
LDQSITPTRPELRVVSSWHIFVIQKEFLIDKHRLSVFISA